jgi:hypothetical protein
MKRTVIVSLLITSVLATAMPKSAVQNPFKWLSGTWKLKNREAHEIWQIAPNNALTGQSYRIKGKLKQIDETLRIARPDTAYYYYAKVTGQNKGLEIPFRIVSLSDTGFVAVNVDHDYPKMIRYRMMNDTLMRVSLSGDSIQRTVVLDYVRKHK